jgi:hypothetical protein
MHLLTFELNETKDELTIHGGPDGLLFLCETIERLIANTDQEGFNHKHLATEEWAGTELSSESQGGEILNQVKIYCWKNKAGE